MDEERITITLDGLGDITATKDVFNVLAITQRRMFCTRSKSRENKKHNSCRIGPHSTQGGSSISWFWYNVYKATGIFYIIEKRLNKRHIVCTMYLNYLSYSIQQTCSISTTCLIQNRFSFLIFNIIVDTQFRRINNVILRFQRKIF